MQRALQIPLLNASSEELQKLSRERQLALSLEEMRAVQGYFKTLGRNPTDVEIETFAQTWSEHCFHKTFRGVIALNSEKIDNLFKSTIARATRELSLSWCFSVFEDNAGIVDFEGDVAIAFKVETHNHPSAIEPFGGAATGVGGVIRDILGVWGEPIASTDVLCFGPLDYPYEKLPKNVKHPRFIYSNVVAGIGSYGNSIGIPTVNGAILFDESYVGNPLVYCGTLGLVAKSKYKRSAKAGDAILLVGGRTGRDGLHGVTFASSVLHEKSEEVSRTAVQIGDPILEEKIKRAVLQVREEGLASGITDLGGGGLSSAVGEQAHRYACGARVELDRVPVKYPSMSPWEIWCSESQERMLLLVPKENISRVLNIFEDEEVDAVAIGELTSDGKLTILFRGEIVADVSIDALFSLCPRVVRNAEVKTITPIEPEVAIPRNLTKILLKILSSPNVASKEGVIRAYDHEVRAATVLKPLQGRGLDGPGDAAVLKPLFNSWKGAVISNGINPEYGKLDPYWMAASAIDEAIRNNVACGGRRISLLDNFCWGNPEKPEQLGSLVCAAQACYDFAKAFGTPFISGKDSLYNESASSSVTPTLLISALGIIPDVRKAVSMDLKKAGNLIYIVGETKRELGGSHYYKILGVKGGEVPRVDAASANKNFNAITKAIDLQLIKSCHDLSEGGLAVAAAEMAFAGSIGAELHLNKVPVAQKMREDEILFSESNSRFLVEVEKKNAKKFEAMAEDCDFARIGVTIKQKKLTIKSKNKKLISCDLSSLKRAWQSLR